MSSSAVGPTEANLASVSASMDRAAEGIGVIPWSPQARGKLSRDWDYSSIRTQTDEAFGRLFAKTEEADKKVADRVAEVAKCRKAAWPAASLARRGGQGRPQDHADCAGLRSRPRWLLVGALA